MSWGENKRFWAWVKLQNNWKCWCVSLYHESASQSREERGWGRVDDQPARTSSRPMCRTLRLLVCRNKQADVSSTFSRLMAAAEDPADEETALVPTEGGVVYSSSLKVCGIDVSLIVPRQQPSAGRIEPLQLALNVGLRDSPCSAAAYGAFVRADRSAVTYLIVCAHARCQAAATPARGNHSKSDIRRQK